MINIFPKWLIDLWDYNVIYKIFWANAFLITNLSKITQRRRWSSHIISYWPHSILQDKLDGHFLIKIPEIPKIETLCIFPIFFYFAVVPLVHCIKSQCTCHLHQYMTYYIVSSVKCLSAMYHHNTLLTPVWSRDKHPPQNCEVHAIETIENDTLLMETSSTHGPLKPGHLDPESNSWVGALGKVMTSYHGSDYLKIGPLLWDALRAVVPQRKHRVVSSSR